MEYIKIIAVIYLVASLIIQVWSTLRINNLKADITSLKGDFNKYTEEQKMRIDEALEGLNQLVERFSQPVLPKIKEEFIADLRKRKEVIAIERVLVNNNYVITGEREIAFGHQFKLAKGEIINVYTTGKVYIGGTKNQALEDLFLPAIK